MKDFYEPQTYRIRLKNKLDKSWADWFEGMTISCEVNNTILEGELRDSAALHALLNRIHSLNLTIISLENLSTNQPDIDAVHNE